MSKVLEALPINDITDNIAHANEFECVYMQQPELIKALRKTFANILKVYGNREDVEIYMMEQTEHPPTERDCLSLTLKVVVKPRVEIKYRK